MPSAKSVAKEGGAECLHHIIKSDSTKYLCYTSCANEEWIIHVTDGINVWRLALDEATLESHRDLADISTYDAYFSNFCRAFKNGHVSVLKQGHKVVLSVGSGERTCVYDLYEGLANERKTDLQKALFYFAENCTELNKRLAAREEELAAVKKQRSGTDNQTSALPDLELMKQSRNQAKVVKPQGLSIVNPSTKKRKAAKGVEFE